MLTVVAQAAASTPVPWHQYGVAALALAALGTFTGMLVMRVLKAKDEQIAALTKANSDLAEAVKVAGKESSEAIKGLGKTHEEALKTLGKTHEAGVTSMAERLEGAAKESNAVTRELLPIVTLATETVKRAEDQLRESSDALRALQLPD